MAYTLKSSRVDFRGGKNILASEHVQYVHGGATLDGSKFEAGIVEVGTLLGRNKESGKYEPFLESNKTKLDNFYILNEDHDHDGETDFISGAVIIEGSVYLKKLSEDDQKKVDAFAPLNQNIHFVSHI